MNSAIKLIERLVRKDKLKGFGGICIQLEDYPEFNNVEVTYDDIVSWIRNNNEYINVIYYPENNFKNQYGADMGYCVSFDFVKN